MNNHGNLDTIETIDYDAMIEEQMESSRIRKLEQSELSAYYMELIPTTTIKGERIIAKRKTIIGYCHNQIHRGSITVKLLQEHSCLEKECPFLQKLEDRPFWANLNQQNAEKAKNKKNAKRQRKWLALEKARMEEVTKTLQAEATSVGEGMEVIQVTRERWIYRVFYVSERPFADGNCFPNTLKAFHAIYRDKIIVLRHIKDQDGHAVTTEEFHKRRR